MAHSALLGTLAKSQHGQRMVLWIHPWFKPQFFQLRPSWAQDLGLQAVTPPGIHYAATRVLPWSCEFAAPAQVQHREDPGVPPST